MANHMQASANGSIFGIQSQREDGLPTTRHLLPVGRVLVLTSNDGSGYKSAHRALAKSLGWKDKVHEHRHMNIHGAFVVHTYWLPGASVATSDLPDL